MQYIRRNWFDIGTTAWAVALIIVAGAWFTGPAFAYEEEGDCGAACSVWCQAEGSSCDYYIPGGVCWVYCENGASERCAPA